MGISTSLVLIAVGAILKWAVTASTSGVNLQTPGVVRVGLAADEAAPLERCQLPRDAGGRDAEAVGQVEPAQPPLGRAVELEQQSHVVEPEPVMAGQGHVDVTDDDGAGVGELEG